MRLIEVKTHVIFDGVVSSSSIQLTARFQDVIGDIPVEITLNDQVIVNSTEPDKVFQELERLTTEHPYFKLKLCESPIELRFFVYAMDKVPNLLPQVIIGPYRVDLAIPEKRVAIELDGHEFHKSRQHRTRDAQRDRYLQQQGWKVIRFTGTEIHHDVVGCIEEAIKMIEATPNK